MAELNYKRFGQGEPLIIMHGLYGSSDNWVSIAKALMYDFTIYLLDMRNHGQSPHLGEHNYEMMTDDLVEFMNKQDLFSAIIAGHSMGGKVAMSFAMLHPERVKKLIVVDISPRSYSLSSGDTQLKEHTLILNALNSIDLSRINSRIEVDSALATKIQNERVRQFLLKNLTRTKENIYSWKINIPVLLDSLENVVIGLENDLDEFEFFSRPVLFIKGGKSDYIQAQDEEMISKAFANVQIKTIENASHWVHAEKPDEFISLVKAFIY